jgi:hypothetical protein
VLYIRNLIPIRARLPRRRSWAGVLWQATIGATIQLIGGSLRQKAFVCILPLPEAIAPVLGSYYWRRTEGESPQKPSSYA